MKILSQDQTEVAYDKQGVGPTVILIDGALSFRLFGPMPELAKLLSTHFAVVTYDRRGRGESGDNQPYALEREIEDIQALIDNSGGSSFLYGISSGSCLALEATLKLGEKVKKLAMYEPPYRDDGDSRAEWGEYNRQLNEFLSKGRRGDAVALFMTFVGTPADQIEAMRKTPMWSMLEAVAPTLAYDAAASGKDRFIPTDVSNITAPTLIMHGAEGFLFLKQTALKLSKTIPNAEFRTIEGQTHAVASEAIAPVLAEFFSR
jgi:pimeloyl-ACP methyl ester carboxylesterase